MTQSSRADITLSTAKKLAAASVKPIKAMIGFDGFVDEIIEVVDKRQTATSYERLMTIAQFGAKISAAAGESTNYELIVKQQKLGGNGPIMANALAAIGLGVTYIGNLGFPAVNPVFDVLVRQANVISIGPACHTDALEFKDGKLMLGKLTPTLEVNWSNVVARVGREKLAQTVAESNLIGMVNWTMLPYMNSIWEGLLAEMLPNSAPDQKRIVFIDLADPEKRTPHDLLEAMNILARFQQHAHVILGLNLKESQQVGAVLGLPEVREENIETSAGLIRAKLGVGTVVIHPRKGAAAANEHGSGKFLGPFVASPKISTGAGDHFNAGFVTAQLLGLSIEESLCTGTATSGFYVRNAASPSLADLAHFTRELPPPEAA